MPSNIIAFKPKDITDENDNDISQEMIESGVLFELQTHNELLEKICIHLDTVSPLLSSEQDFCDFHTKIATLTINTQNRIRKLKSRKAQR